jgi:hypothetical protein
MGRGVVRLSGAVRSMSLRPLGVIEVLHPGLHQVASDEPLQSSQRIPVFRGDKTDRISNRLRAARAPDAVHIVFRVHGEVVVDDMRDAVDVDTPGSDVGSHQDSDFALFEVTQGAQPLALGAVRVQRGRRNVLRVELFGQPVGSVFGAGKNQHATKSVGLK